MLRVYSKLNIAQTCPAAMRRLKKIHRRVNSCVRVSSTQSVPRSCYLYRVETPPKTSKWDPEGRGSHIHMGRNPTSKHLDGDADPDGFRLTGDEVGAQKRRLEPSTERETFVFAQSHPPRHRYRPYERDAERVAERNAGRRAAGSRACSLVILKLARQTR